MGSTPSKQINKNVVVIGSGYAGCAVASQLDSVLNVTLITPTNSLIHKIGAVRNVVTNDWEDYITLPLNKLLSRGSIKHGKAVELKDNSVILEDGESVAFDYCVIAIGATNSFSDLHELLEGDTKELWVKYRDHISKASKIMVVGGGIVGFEVTGELLTMYPEKDITLVHSCSTLGNSSSRPEYFHPKLSIAVESKLASKGATVKLGYRANIKDLISKSKLIPGMLEPYATGSMTVTLTPTDTSSGQEVETIEDVGVIINTTGYRVNTIKGINSGSEGIKVDKYFTVDGHSNIFAIGDAADAGEVKQGSFVGKDAMNKSNKGHAGICAKEIIRRATLTVESAINDSKSTPSTIGSIEYKANTKPLCFASLGPYDGVAIVGSMRLPSFVPRKLKSGNLFTPKSYSDINLNAPKVVPPFKK